MTSNNYDQFTKHGNRWDSDQDKFLLDAIKNFDNCIPYLEVVGAKMGRTARALLLHLREMSLKLKKDNHSIEEVVNITKLPNREIECLFYLQGTEDILKNLQRPESDLQKKDFQDIKSLYLASNEKIGALETSFGKHQQTMSKAFEDVKDYLFQLSNKISSIQQNSEEESEIDNIDATPPLAQDDNHSLRLSILKNVRHKPKKRLRQTFTRD